MRIPLLFLAVSILSAQAPALSPVVDPASLSVDQVLAKAFEAQGGLAKLKSIQSRRILGHIEGLPTPVSFDQLNARPDRIRLEMKSQGAAGTPEAAATPSSDQVKTFDGKVGWAWSDSEAARLLAPEEIQVLDADFDGPLLDAASKGNRISYLGVKSFQNQKALVLKVVLKDKRVQTIYLDPKTFLKFAQVNGEGKFGVELDFWDYQEVEGMPVAFTVIIGPVSVRIDKIQFNVPVSDADFQPPAK